jgi:hypothetical protein
LIHTNEPLENIHSRVADPGSCVNAGIVYEDVETSMFALNRIRNRCSIRFATYIKVQIARPGFRRERLTVFIKDVRTENRRSSFPKPPDSGCAHALAPCTAGN